MEGMAQMPRWNYRPLTNPNDKRIRAARRLLYAGLVTMAEAAVLAGCTRQHMHSLTSGLNPVQRRTRYLRQLWREALDKMDA